MSLLQNWHLKILNRHTIGMAAKTLAAWQLCNAGYVSTSKRVVLPQLV